MSFSKRIYQYAQYADVRFKTEEILRRNVFAMKAKIDVCSVNGNTCEVVSKANVIAERFVF